MGLAPAIMDTPSISRWLQRPVTLYFSRRLTPRRMHCSTHNLIGHVSSRQLIVPPRLCCVTCRVLAPCAALSPSLRFPRLSAQAYRGRCVKIGDPYLVHFLIGFAVAVASCFCVCSTRYDVLAFRLDLTCVLLSQIAARGPTLRGNSFACSRTRLCHVGARCQLLLWNKDPSRAVHRPQHKGTGSLARALYTEVWFVHVVWHMHVHQ